MTTEESVEIFRRLKMGEQGQVLDDIGWFSADMDTCLKALIEEREVRIKPSPPKPRRVSSSNKQRR